MRAFFVEKLVVWWRPCRNVIQCHFDIRRHLLIDYIGIYRDAFGYIFFILMKEKEKIINCLESSKALLPPETYT